MTVVRGRYELLDVVGRGGQGLVFRARDRQHDRTVALKMRLAAGDPDAVLSEARILLGLRPHSGLPLVREDFFEGDRYYVAMDWVEGRSLRDVLWERGDDAVPPGEILAWLEPVAEALDHLHAHEPPIVHGDVKPANVLVREDRSVVLVDFGIAGGEGGRAGTPGYAAPEVLAGARPSPAADVFGLAATAYALLTGAPPRPGARPHWHGLSRDVRARLQRALERGLAMDPERRPARATELIALLRGEAAPPTNVPAAATSFVGREREADDVAALVRSSRLVTLTGAGGIGKTRLATRVAAGRLAEHPDGVWLVELAALSDPGLVPQAVASALGVREEPGVAVQDALAEHLRSRALLLVLDNCEHVVEACATLVEPLLGSCPKVRVLATSREPLGAAGETTWRVPSLSMPAPGAPPDDLERSESVRLFVERARLADPAFAADDLGTVAQISRTLDGIPLAIELAAARVRAMPVVEIAARLDDRFALLTGGRRTALPRQRTLRALVDWSWDLLESDERAALARLSVFAGGFTLATAEAVCDAPPDLVARLVDRSLLVPRADRYEMLETIRRYATERLRELGGEDEVRARHRDAFRALAEEADGALQGPGQQEWLDHLEREHDNVRAALATAIDAADGALAIATGVWRFWEVRGYLTEGRRWLASALAAEDDEPTALRAKALQRAGGLAHRQGDYAAAEGLYEESLQVARDAGDDRVIADAVHNLATIAYASGDYPAARHHSEEALRIRRRLGDERGVADSLGNLCVYAMAGGDYAAARAFIGDCLPIYRALGDRLRESDALMNLGAVAEEQADTAAAVLAYEESLAIRRELGDPWRIAHSVGNLAGAVLLYGDPIRAGHLFDESLALQHRLEDRDGVAYALLGLAAIARENGDTRAGAMLREALKIRIDLGDSKGTAECLEAIAGLAAVAGDGGRALRLFGAADAIRSTVGAPIPPSRAPAREADVARAKAGLDAEAAASALAEGLRMPRPDAIALALGD